MNPSQITVVMPLYNNATEVERAVNSVLAQTVTYRELIVVNDGSTDGGEEKIRAMRDDRIRVVDQKNKGVSAARNRGVAEAQSDIVAFLDADDEWKPDFLETILRLHTLFPTCTVFATHYFYRALDGSLSTPILRNAPPGDWEGILENYFNVAAHSDPPLWSSAVAVKRSALLSVGGFPENIAIGEDLLTWARLAVNGKIAYSKKQCSVFWLRGSLTGYPTRTPEIPDHVGEQLEGLLPQVPANQQKDFSFYAGMWHRMRASMFIYLENTPETLAEVAKIRHYVGLNSQAVLYYILAVTPRMIRKVVLQSFTFVRMLRRRIVAR